MEFIFATSNSNKVVEVKKMLPKDFDIKSLEEIGFKDELPETQDTIEGNSLQKATTLYAILGKNCFAEDTGLEVETLDGEPGVKSARYAGEGKNSNDNIDLLLEKLKGKPNRRAQFKTVITLIIDDNIQQFKGVLEGEIGFKRKGEHGFGYDSVFVIDNGKTLAELSLNEKSGISHRGKAVHSLVEYLQKEYI